MNKKIISRLLMLVLSLVLIFGITSCTETYQMTFNPNNGENAIIKNFKLGEKITFPSVEKEGYTLKEWQADGVSVTNDLTASVNLTFNAVWEINKYNYTFIVNNKVISEGQAEHGSSVSAPSVDPITGYKFVGWDKEITNISNDIVVNGILEEIKVTEINVEAINELTINKTSKIKVTVKPTDALNKEVSYESSDSSTATIDNTGLIKGIKAGEVIITIKCGNVSKQITVNIIDEKTYTVKYVVESKVVDEHTYKESEKYTEYTTIPTKASDDDYDYSFDKWDKATDNDGNITFTASFKQSKKTTKFTSLENKKISIMGDSITTFYDPASTVNSYYSVSGSYYYPTYCKAVSTWDLTWWGRLIKNTKMTLGINNAYSGSCAGGSQSNAGWQDSRVNSLIENGAPDIFIYYLGTNDVAAGYSASDFEVKLRLTLEKVNKICTPQIFLTKLGYSAYKGMKYTDALRLEYNAVIDKVAKEFGYGIINLDQYVIDDNYSIYLHDNLHYNLKGTELLSKIAEKDIKEYNGIAFNETITVEHKEKLPEGVIAYCTVTANDGKFWAGTNYVDYIYISNVDGENAFSSPTFSYRICFSKDTTDNKYKVVKIITNGTKDSYIGEYAITVSSSYSAYKDVEETLKNVSLGDIVEFENIDTMPCKLTFKKGTGGTITPTEPEEKEGPVTKDGYLHIGSFNKGEWSVYDSKVILYEQAKLDRGSSYINFNIISLKKVTDTTYEITNKKDAGPKTTFDDCDYYVLIYSSLDVGNIYSNCSVGQIVTIIGDITTGACNIDFSK